MGGRLVCSCSISYPPLLLASLGLETVAGKGLEGKWQSLFLTSADVCNSRLST